MDRPISKQLGRYELVEEIGQGTLSTVYRAQEIGGRRVAMKVLKPAVAREERRLLRFYQGARLCMQLAHPNVVQTLEVGCHEGWHFVAMEYIEGGNLAQYVMRRGKLSERRALQTIIAIASAVEHIHQHGMLHRDINPANILIANDGRVVIADMGLAKDQVHDLKLTVDGYGLGTPDYIAPEQFRDTKELGPTADVYGLGATLFVMLTAKLPFAGDTLGEKWMAKIRNSIRPVEQYCPIVHAETAELIRQAMSADPAGRPANAAEFIATAQRCLAAVEASEAAIAAELPAPATAAPQGQWHVLLPARDGSGVQCRTADEATVRRLLAEKAIGPDTLVSRGGGERFQRLAQQAAFRDLFTAPKVIAPAQPAPPLVATPVLPSRPLRSAAPLRTPVVATTPAPVAAASAVAVLAPMAASVTVAAPVMTTLGLTLAAPAVASPAPQRRAWFAGWRGKLHVPRWGETQMRRFAGRLKDLAVAAPPYVATMLAVVFGALALARLIVVLV